MRRGLYTTSNTLSKLHFTLLKAPKPHQTAALGTTANMSNFSLANLPYISREALAAQIRESHSSSETTSTSTSTSTSDTPSNLSLPSNIAIIDVRDSDHVGGHIRGSTWVPSSQLDYKMPELLRTLKGKEVVVFHCALSQQRGPGAALRYAREMEAKMKEGNGGEVKERDGEGVKDGGQKVVVLKGGFTEWQEKYGRDERLTEGWEKGVWEDDE
jgi:rhodanese-related sulfurtransferase